MAATVAHLVGPGGRSAVIDPGLFFRLSAVITLTGGLASPLSTLAAAFFRTGLNQMMLIMGLPTLLQFVVFGLVIIGGMLVSGDRIIRGVEHLLRERKRPGFVQTPVGNGASDRTT